LFAVAPIIALAPPPEDEAELKAAPEESSSLVMPDAESPSAEQGSKRGSSNNFKFSPRGSVDAGAFMIPHPEKAHKNGEDAYFISASKKMLAVADGVGGWAELHVDPSLFSKSLCASVGQHAENGYDDSQLQAVMQAAYDDTCDKGIEGSSTLCMAFIYSDHVKTCNLGDSGMRVIRNNDVIFRTQEQVHQFNFPFQLGSRGRGEAEHPYDAACDRAELESGDVIIMGTDGLFDNLFDHQLVKLVRDNSDKPAEEIAKIIAQAASSASVEPALETPFARAAAENGLTWFGGKLDDITVIVAKF
jgi:protein phosphatase PTC7